MASVASQLLKEVTAHAQSDSFEDALEICADGTYFPNNLRSIMVTLLSTGVLRTLHNYAYISISSQGNHWGSLRLFLIKVYNFLQIYSLAKSLYLPQGAPTFQLVI